MKKRISILIFAAVAACASFAFAISSAAGNKTNKTVVYKYALLGDTYKVESGLVSAKTPSGEEISSAAETVFLDWAQGSYIFEYGAKIVNLKVYESAPADEVIYGGEIPSVGTAGEAMNFPSARVISGIKRTDGAPDVGEYAVTATLWHEGVKKETVRDIAEGFAFTPSSGGLWVISYRYTDVFGRERSVDSVFSVESRRIILTDILGEYYIGDKISLAETYGFYNGERYSVTARLTLPSGETVTLGKEYVFPAAGSYSLALRAEAGGETVEKTIAITVKTGLASFVTDKNGFGEGVAFENLENVKVENQNALLVNPQSLLFDMTASGATFKYNGVIDLKKLGKNTPVISFTTNNSYGGSVSAIEVTLTDVYDAKRAVTVRFAKNSDITETSLNYDNTLVRASFGSISTAINNYSPLKTDAVAWDTLFSAYWRSPAYVNPDKNYNAADKNHPMNFAYDVGENCVYGYGSYGETSQTGEKWYKIADLEGSSLPVKFEGFTTGEVYLSLKVASGRGDIVVQSIGGKADVTASDYETADGILVGSFDGSVPAVKGVAYALPTYHSDYIKDLTVSVRDENGNETPVTKGSFVAAKAGEYTVSYSGVNVFGKNVSKTFGLKCVERQIETEIGYDVSEEVPFGSVYTIKEPEISGGHGKVSYKIYYCGEEFATGDKVVINDENAPIIVKTVDELGFGNEKSFTLNVDKDVVSFTVDFPRTAIKGSEFTFPEATAKYLLTGENLSYEIYVDGVKAGRTITLPSDKKSVEAEYRTAHGSKKFTLYLKSAAVSGRDALLFDGTAKTTYEGTKITLDAGANEVKLPYRLSPNALRAEFFVMADKLNFNSFSVVLTDKRDVAVKITIKDLKKDNPVLFINGENTGVKIIKRVQTFSSSASAEYAGKDYYNFAIIYENFYNAVLSGRQVLSYVAKDAKGIAFNGFDGGVYADLTFEETTGDVEFVLTRLSNQYFYEASFAEGDKTAPAPYSSKIRLGDANVTKGYELDVSDMAAFDVLQKSSGITLTLTAPDKTKVYENATPAAAGKRVLDKTGVYVLNVVTADESGTSSNVTYRFVVEDRVAPVLMLKGTIPAKVKTGETVKLCGASATDESAVKVKITVIRPDGKVVFPAEGDGNASETTLKVSSAGIYTVIYSAEDAYGNVTSEIHAITAEE